VKLELEPKFNGLLTIVKTVEQSGDVEVFDAARFERVCRDFGQNYKSVLAEINSATLQQFSNFKLGAHILNVVLKQLVTYYQQFLKQWSQKFPSNTLTQNQPVPVQQLLAEIKTKYKSGF
jgi:vacuolar protein sorting-associated protein 52